MNNVCLFQRCKSRRRVARLPRPNIGRFGSLVSRPEFMVICVPAAAKVQRGLSAACPAHFPGELSDVACEPSAVRLKRAVLPLGPVGTVLRAA